ncbi:MAG: hypothetical protein LBC80_10240, partial [Treponema sp.]|nr:hypothetical protein [Treponema sp.]
MQYSYSADLIFLDSRPKFKSITSHPFFAFIMLGLIMVFIQLLQRVGIVNFSFSKAIGQTAIYAIAVLGFCFLLGYAGLASLGTAGFAGLGAYITGFLLNTYTQLPYWSIFFSVILVAVILGTAVGFISLRI